MPDKKKKSTAKKKPTTRKKSAAKKKSTAKKPDILHEQTVELGTILRLTWNKRKKRFVAHDGQVLESFKPHTNRTHVGWLLDVVPRYQITRVNEHEYTCFIEGVTGAWVYAVGRNECNAICAAFLNLLHKDSK